MISDNGDYALIFEKKGLNSCKKAQLFELYKIGENKLISELAYNNSTFYTIIYDTLNRKSQRYIEGTDTSLFLITEKTSKDSFFIKYSLQSDIIDVTNSIDVNIDTVSIFTSKIPCYIIDSKNCEQKVKFYKFRITINYCNQKIYQTEFDTDEPNELFIVEEKQYNLYLNKNQNTYLLTGYFIYKVTNTGQSNIERREGITLLKKNFR